jgi:hypothetical protein
MQTTLMTNSNIHAMEYLHKPALEMPKKLSDHALCIINSHYKNNHILIQYVNETITYDGYNTDGPEIEMGTLFVILHVGYQMNKNTNTCIPLYQYDRFHFEYIIGKESVPEYCIDETLTTYHNIVDINLF